jgi:CRISPR-associated exonuclease Cas4
VLNIPKQIPIWVNEGQEFHKSISKMLKRRTLSKFGVKSALFEENVSLAHKDYRFYGVCDGLIFTNLNIIPIEMKLHGNKPTYSQKMQLVAYGMLAEKIFEKEFNSGFILYEKKSKNIPLMINAQDKENLLNIVDEIIVLIDKGLLPNSSADEKKCLQCEFENYCNDRF